MLEFTGVQPGESLRQVLERAGGLTPNAYLFGAEFTRASTRVAQQARLDDYVSQLELEIDRGVDCGSGQCAESAGHRQFAERPADHAIADCEAQTAAGQRTHRAESEAEIGQRRGPARRLRWKTGTGW